MNWLSINCQLICFAFFYLEGLHAKEMIFLYYPDTSPELLKESEQFFENHHMHQQLIKKIPYPGKSQSCQDQSPTRGNEAVLELCINPETASSGVVVLFSEKTENLKKRFQSFFEAPISSEVIK